MTKPGDLSVQQLSRNGLVIAGALLLLVGMGDLIVGRTKISQYAAIVREGAAIVPRRTPQLFPTATEAQERHALAIAKLGYYQLLFTAGQGLSALGFVVLAIGVLQIRIRSLRGDVSALTSGPSLLEP